MLNRLPWGRLAWCLAAALFTLIGLAWHFETASRLHPEALEPRYGSLVLDRTGRVLRLAPEPRGGKLVTLPESAIPQMVAAAFVAAEDQRFWRHPGIDPLAILRAAWSNIQPRPHRLRGLHPHPATGAAHLPSPRSYYRKIVEMGRSLRMELVFSKEEILRRYLDRVPLGNNLLGVERRGLGLFRQNRLPVDRK